MEDSKNSDNISNAQKPKTNRSVNQKHKLMLVAILFLVSGFVAGFFVSTLRQDKATNQSNQQLTGDDVKTAPTEDTVEEETFEAAPIKQAPETSNTTQTVDPLKTEIKDSVITTYTYEGTDNKTYTKNVIMAKMSVTNNSNQPILFDTYPLNLKDKNNELVNATFYAFLPSELSWYGGHLHAQTISSKQTVVGVITFEVPAGVYNAGKSPLKMHLEKIDKTFEFTPRQVDEANHQ